jgi:hypothetical protein
MVQQIINVGSAPNDGTGDPLRIAAGKVNANFAELYDPNTLTVRKRLAQGSQTVLYVSPVSPMTNAIGGNDSIGFGLVVTSGRWQNGPVSQPQYWNTVVSLGLNFQSNGGLTPLNPSMPIPRIAIEGKFTQGPSTPFISEFHLVSMLNPGVFPEYRGISAVVPHDPAFWRTHTETYMRSGRTLFADGLSSPRVHFDFRTQNNPVIELISANNNGVKIQQHANGTPWLLQFNAACNRLLSLPHIDSRDRLRISQPLTVLGGPMSVGAFGLSTGIEANFTNAQPNSYLLYIYNSTAVTGRMFASFLSSPVAGPLSSVLRNTTAGGQAGYKATVTNGVSFLEFEDLGQARRFAWRFDAVAGRLSLDDGQEGAAAARTAMSVNHARMQVEFNTAPRLPSFTVATLPSPVTVGAGALAMCTNETGGATVVFSDGTRWRRVTDRQIAA